MTPHQQECASAYLGDRISYQTLVRAGLDPVGDPDFVRRVLHETTAARDATSLGWGLALSLHFDLVEPEHAVPLAELLLESWHCCHEDIAKTLQSLQVAETADALAQAALMKHEYLACNNSLALARKCVWALADIGTPAARAHLVVLSKHADPELAGYARRRLERWEQELARKLAE